MYLKNIFLRINQTFLIHKLLYIKKYNSYVIKISKPIMKTFTNYPLLIATLGLTILGGCKKNSSSNDSNNNNGNNGGYVKTKYNTNSVTATATCDFDVSDTAYTNHGWT